MIRFVCLDLSSEIFSLVWFQPLLRTLELIAVSVTLAAVIGIVGAWAASSLHGFSPIRSSFQKGSGQRLGRGIAKAFLIAMVVAIAMPMILHAAAWEATAGKFGWMIMTQTGARADGVAGYGFFGGLIACGWIHGLYGAALVSLATWHGTSRTPTAVVQQSRLERGSIATWWRVRLPMAAPWIFAALLGTALLAATEMTVVDLYGYRTLADEFYLFYSVDPSIVSVMMTCFVPLFLTAMLLTWLTIERKKFIATQSDTNYHDAASDVIPTRWRFVSGLLAISVAALIVAVPLGGLCVKIGQVVTVDQGVIETTWSMSSALERLADAPRVFSAEYRWTALIALVTGVTAVGVTVPLAALGRVNRRWERVCDLGSVALVVVPGPIVGLSVVSLFQLDIPGFHTLYQQTILPVVLALLVRAVPVAYWVLRAGYRGIGDPVLDAARLDGSRVRRWWSIEAPLIRIQILIAGLAAAIVASGDVPATLPVAPPGVSTVGTRLFGLLHSGARYQESALAIVYVAAVVLASLVIVRQRPSSLLK